MVLGGPKALLNRTCPAENILVEAGGLYFLNSFSLRVIFKLRFTVRTGICSNRTDERIGLMHRKINVYAENMG